MTRPDLIYDDVNALYGLRSGIIHGSVLTPRALSKSIRRVSSASRTSLLGQQIELALDRWRDLLRRAILARAALAAEPSLWPLKSSVDADRELRTESRRAAWLAHIHRYWADVGLASAVALLRRYGSRSRAPKTVRRTTTARIGGLQRSEAHASESTDIPRRGTPERGNPRPAHDGRLADLRLEPLLLGLPSVTGSLQRHNQLKGSSYGLPWGANPRPA